MLSACCSTAWPTISSTFSGCNSLRRCAPHKSKLCAFSCSRSARASAKQLVVFAFTWPAAGPFKISSSLPRSVTPVSLSRPFDKARFRRVRRSHPEKTICHPQNAPARGSTTKCDPSLPKNATIQASNELSRLGLYRKRERARSGQGHAVYARFRCSDMKEAARDCGGRGLMQIQLREGAVLKSAQTVL